MPSLTQILAPNEREYFDLFVRAGTNIVRAAGLLEEILASYPDRRELAGVIHDCEHEGDRIVHDVIQRLNHTFVTLFEGTGWPTLGGAARSHGTNSIPCTAALGPFTSTRVMRPVLGFSSPR